jgi:hypothetical protein
VVETSKARRNLSTAGRLLAPEERNLCSVLDAGLFRTSSYNRRAMDGEGDSIIVFSA